MQIRKDFTYYYTLSTLITHALLHLLTQVSMSQRYVPIAKRNDILLKYLKPKVNSKTYASVKKDIKLMLATARNKSGNLERKLYELNEKSNQTTINGAEKLYALLVYLYDEEGIESRLFDEGKPSEPGVLYMLEEHIEHCYQADRQVAPLSMLIQSERAPKLVDSINRHGSFMAKMQEWNVQTHQAHIQLYPSA